jgi:hypothetical protein
LIARFGRVFAMLDSEKFCECFRKWTESLRRAIDGEVVALDGKTLRRSHDRFRNKGSSAQSLDAIACRA